MSMETIAHVYAYSKTRNPADRAVLVAIAHHTNQQTGLAYPSELRLAACTCLNIRTVRNAIKRLEQHGEIVIERGRGRGHFHVYRITLKGERNSSFIPEKEECGSPFSPKKRGTSFLRKEERGSPEPNTEPKEKKKRRFLSPVKTGSRSLAVSA